MGLSRLRIEAILQNHVPVKSDSDNDAAESRARDKGRTVIGWISETLNPL